MKVVKCTCCKRPNVRIVTSDGKCHLCNKIDRIHRRIEAGETLPATDLATVHRVLKATRESSTERRVAEDLGYIPVWQRFTGQNGNGKPVPPATLKSWPRPVAMWLCSDGTPYEHEVDALRHELSLRA